jgi:hypothetical protein
MKNTNATNMKSQRIMVGRTSKPVRLTTTPMEQKVSPIPKRGGVFFRSPLTGTVLAATAACFPVKTVTTPLGTLVTAVDQFNWAEYGGLKYWVDMELPSLPADQCKCKAGDLISWYGAAK